MFLPSIQAAMASAGNGHEKTLNPRQEKCSWEHTRSASAWQCEANSQLSRSSPKLLNGTLRCRSLWITGLQNIPIATHNAFVKIETIYW